MFTQWQVKCPCIGEGVMSTTIKYSFAILVLGLLLLNPLSACAAMSKAPPHPCCPAPSQNDYAKPTCVCGRTVPAAISAPPTEDSGRVIAVPVTDAMRGTDISVPRWSAFEYSPFPCGQLFVALHQFLI